MAPTDLPTKDPAPASSPGHVDGETSEDKQLSVAGMMTGTALIFIGFLNVFLSISGGFEINAVPLLIYFAGIAVWANAVIENPTLRYSVMIGAIAIGLAFFHYGEVLFWHKQVVFWMTVVVVMYFMFREPKTPDR